MSSSSQITAKELNDMRKHLMASMSILTVNQVRFPAEDYNDLVNKHEYMLHSIDNMKHRFATQYQYNAPSLKAIKESGETVTYDVNGESHVEKKAEILNTSFAPAWMKQFTSNVVNPPSYMMPPTGVFDVEKIQTMTKVNPEPFRGFYKQR